MFNSSLHNPMKIVRTINANQCVLWNCRHIHWILCRNVEAIPLQQTTGVMFTILETKRTYDLHILSTTVYIYTYIYVYIRIYIVYIYLYTCTCIYIYTHNIYIYICRCINPSCNLQVLPFSAPSEFPAFLIPGHGELGCTGWGPKSSSRSVGNRWDML